MRADISKYSSARETDSTLAEKDLVLRIPIGFLATNDKLVNVEVTVTIAYSHPLGHVFSYHIGTDVCLNTFLWQTS